MAKTPASQEATGAKAATLKAWAKFFSPPKVGESASMTSANT